MTQVADAYVRLVVDEKDLEKSLTSASGKAGQAAEAGGQTVGSRFGSAFSKASTVAGAAAGTFLVAGIESATVFEDQLRTINTVARLSDEELGKVGDQIQQVSRDTGKTTDDLAAGFYDLVSAGVSAEDAIAVLTDSAKLSVGALGTTGEAVDAVTSALNAYGLDASESTRVTDILAKAVESGKVTIAEIGSTLANVAPIAASAGISLEEVSAGYAALTSKGVPAAQAATQMRAAISALLTPNEQLNKVQEKTGINFAELARTEGLANALEKLRTEFAANGDALAILAGESGVEGFQSKLAQLGPDLGLTVSEIEKLSAVAGKDGAAAAYNDLAKYVGESDSGFAKALGSVEALNFALITTGDGAEGFQQQITDTANASGIAAEQYNEKSKSVAEQGKRLVATFTTFAQDVGGPFVGSLGQGVFALNELGRAFGIPIPAAKIFGGAIGGLGGKLLPKLVGGLKGIVPALGSALVGLVPALGGAVTGLVTGIGGLFAAAIPLLVAALPILLIGAIVAAIVVLLVNEDIRNAVFDFIGGILGWIGDALGGLAQIFADAFGQALAIVGEILGQIGELIGTAIQLWIDYVLLWPVRVAEVFLHVLGIIGEFVMQAIAVVGEWVGGIVELILSIPGRIVGLIAMIVQGWINIGTRVIGAVTGFVGKVVSIILGIPGKIVGLIGEFGKIAQRAVQAFIGFIADIPGKVAGILGGIGDFIGGIIPKFQSGTLYSPEGLAYLHAGEIVVPKEQADAIRAGTATLGTQGSERSVNVNVYNPTPEPASTSTERELRKLAYMGVTG